MMMDAKPELEKARETVTQWLADANAVALLRAAYDSNALALLATPMTTAELAEKLGIDEAAVGFFCQALEAHGIVQRDGDLLQTRPAFLALDGEDQPLRLRELVAANEALQRGIETSLKGAAGFNAVEADESLALARLAWGRPASPSAQAMWNQVDQQMPEVREIWRAGGTYAEFGCGAGRDLLRVAVMYPGVSVIGHELLPHLLDDCRAQARVLGVADRVRFELGDVLELEAEACYDTLMWSQMFFPPETREAALAVIWRALVPNGYLMMPVMPAVPAPGRTDETMQTRGLLLARLAYPRWQIQWESEETLQHEVTGADFEYLRTITNPRTPYLLFRKQN
jgi:SAM-dependent methyltransferase